MTESMEQEATDPQPVVATSNAGGRKRAKRIAYVLDAEGGTVTFDVIDSTKGAIKIAPADFPVDMQLMFALHGAKQKGGDCVTQADTPDDLHDEILGTFSTIMDGKWRERGEGAVRDSMVLDAVADLYGVSVEDARGMRDAADDAQWKEVAQHPRVKAAVAAIQAAKAEEKASDSDALPTL